MFDFYKNKKVFITGHTGFKGSWLCKILTMAGANVTGLSLTSNKDISVFDILDINNEVNSIIGDIRDLVNMKKVICNFKPEIVFHLAAQPIVKESYNNPVYTFETNVMGTVNLLEAIRFCDSVRSVVNITTDKVYQNNEWYWGYRENEPLNGFDPYSNSKSCSELVTNCYKKSFFDKNSILSVSTARAGNVIGGGDFSKYRIIPDCIRAAIKGRDIIIHNPHSIRPYQHVFEALNAYLLIAQYQYNNKSIEGSYNVGPNEEGCVTTGLLADMFCKSWGNLNWINKSEDDAVHESNFLKLDCSKINNAINWHPKMNIEEAINLTVDWTKSYFNGEDINKVSEEQIKAYFR